MKEQVTKIFAQEQLETFKTLLRPDEAAGLLKVSRWTIYRWIQEGRIEATKVGKGAIRVFGHSIEKLVEQNRL